MQCRIGLQLSVAYGDDHFTDHRYQCSYYSLHDIKKIFSRHVASRGLSATDEPLVSSAYLSGDVLEVLEPGVTTEVDGGQRRTVACCDEQTRHQQRVDRRQCPHLHRHVPSAASAGPH